MSFKSAIKGGLTNAIAAAGPVLWRLAMRPKLLILMYHRVLPMGHPDREFEQPGMIVAPETLEMHIRVLRQYFELMHLDDWVRRCSSGAPLPRLACALTFDDGWRDNLDYAFPVLQAARAPATIYLVSSMVGGAYTFWPTSLARQLCGAWARRDENLLDGLAQRCPAVNVPMSVPAGSERNSADAVIGALKENYDDATLREVALLLDEFTTKSADSDLLSWSQIRQMAASELVRFGSHTCTHARLDVHLALAVVQQEIDRSAAHIESELGAPPAGFCYPNGDHSPSSVELVRKRYSHAVTTKFGWNDESTDRALLRRVGVHDDVSDIESKFLARVTAGI